MMSISLPVIGQVVSKSAFGDPVANALNAITDGTGIVTSGASTFSGAVTIGGTSLTAAWSTYAVAWTASAGTPAIGNGTLSGRYRQIGKCVDFFIGLAAGTTTTYGTAGAYWIFSLPASVQGGIWPISAFGFDQGVLEYPLQGVLGYNTTSTVVLLKPGSGRHLNNSPWTFGTSDVLYIAGRYESA